MVNEPVGKYLPQLARMRVGNAGLRRQPGADRRARSRGDDPGPDAPHLGLQLRPRHDAAAQDLPGRLRGVGACSGPAPSSSTGSPRCRCTSSRARRGNTASASTCSGSRSKRSPASRCASSCDERAVRAARHDATPASSCRQRSVARYAKALPNDPLTREPQTLRDGTKLHKFDCGGGCAVSTALGLPALRADAAERRRARRRAHPRAQDRRVHDRRSHGPRDRRDAAAATIRTSTATASASASRCAAAPASPG